MPVKCNCYLFNMEDIQNKQRQSQTFPPKTYTLKVLSTAGRLAGWERRKQKKLISDNLLEHVCFFFPPLWFQISTTNKRKFYFYFIVCFFGFCILCNFLLDSSHCECYLLGTKYFNILINILEVCSEIQLTFLETVWSFWILVYFFAQQGKSSWVQG